jgi:putative endonuclease
MSEEPQRRLEFHNTQERGFTARYRPWELVFVQAFETKAEALAAERRIKSWKSRSMVERVIRGELMV